MLFIKELRWRLKSITFNGNTTIETRYADKMAKAYHRKRWDKLVAWGHEIYGCPEDNNQTFSEWFTIIKRKKIITNALFTLVMVFGLFITYVNIMKYVFDVCLF